MAWDGPHGRIDADHQALPSLRCEHHSTPPDQTKSPGQAASLVYCAHHAAELPADLPDLPDRPDLLNLGHSSAHSAAAAHVRLTRRDRPAPSNAHNPRISAGSEWRRGNPLFHLRSHALSGHNVHPMTPQ
jgi:hypothetical protein